jgi:hypothetical protein
MFRREADGARRVLTIDELLPQLDTWERPGIPAAAAHRPPGRRGGNGSPWSSTHEPVPALWPTEIADAFAVLERQGSRGRRSDRLDSDHLESRWWWGSPRDRETA